MADRASPLARPCSGGEGPLGVFLICGFSDAPARLRPLGEALARAGCRVRLPLLAGRGAFSDGTEPTGWRDWLAAARREYSALRKECRRTAVGGLSMGGVLALLLAEEYVLDGVVAISAPMFPRRACLSPRARRSKDAARLTRMADRNLYAVSAPILVVSAGKDETAAARSAGRILSGVSSRVKEELVLPHTRQESPDGPDRELLIQSVTAFLSDIQEGKRT